MRMARNYNVAVLGATGLVGQESIKLLEKRNFPVASIHLFGADHATGRKLPVGQQQLEVREVTPESFNGIDIAFFSGGAESSNHFAAVAVQSGAVVIDSSAVFRTAPAVPLVVPEVNPEAIKGHKGIIANPDAVVIPLAVALYPLHKVNPVKRVIVTTYQSVSGTGGAAIEELMTQTRQVLDGQSAIPHVYPHQIAFNVLPETDVFLDNGYTREEWRLMEETRRLMHAESLAVSATCVRVPVLVGLAEAINVEFSQPMLPGDAEYILAQAPGVKLMDDTSISLYPQPWSIVGSDDVYIGRVHRDESHPNGLFMWVVVDNLRKGSALNAVQIAEEMIKRDWLRPRR